ncbi:MAG: glycoside hydrolase/phage tail family protein [Beijerinckiaceae bacterium]
MATLVLQTAGAVIGSFLGGPIGGAIGSVIGATAGSVIDQSLISSVRSKGGRKTVSGPRLKDLDGISATEGAAIPRLYGRARLGGQVIWATRFEEEAVYSRTKPRGGKGGIGGGGGSKAVIEVSYRYYANVAIGLCEGPVGFVRRVWADGKLLDLTTVTMRFHHGGSTQEADPLILAKQGAGGAPAYRGLAYVVFERLPIESFGNRLPQFTFEVVRPVHGLCRRIQAFNIIPGAGEHVYEPAVISISSGLGASRLPNRAQLTHATNWIASMDAMQALCPGLRNVALVVAWFGNDLRVGQCTIQPLTEPGTADSDQYPWAVAGLTRATAGTVSLTNGKPSFGGTPSDASVIRAIRDLKARGLQVTLYPFIMMDVPVDNARGNPYTGDVSQPPFPWRGRMTCDPAPGRPSSPEGTAGADAQVAQFMGSCVASDFAVDVNSVSYSGPQEWTLRRLVLHTAALGQAAGGVDALVLASELVALTRIRGTGAVNPAVAGLKALAAEARQLAGSSTKITYGADWTEYGAEVRAGGSDIRFPLDPLWGDSNIDAVSIDWYPPVTDWRDGLSHRDAADYDGPLDPQMFSDRIAGGEAFDWFYADDASRITQQRLPITDGAYSKPWIYRPKDLSSWWSNPHFNRAGGVELGAPTEWVPQSKPIWLLELGCPAVDRGGTGPNVFPDPKSSENAAPPFSRGIRDDCVQARHLGASLDHFQPGSGTFRPANNPVSAIYSSWMVDPLRIYLWTYDARPFPAFPDHAEIWSDATNFETGHWLNGRLEGAPVDDVVAAVFADYGEAPPARIAADGFLEGYVIDRPLSLRGVIEPLSEFFGFDAVLAGGIVRFVRRSAKPVMTLASDAFAVTDKTDRPVRTRAQSTELPVAVTLAFTDVESDFRQGAVRVVVPDPAGSRQTSVEAPIALRRPVALHRASTILNETRTARESITFALPPSNLALEPGDAVIIDGRSYRIQRVNDGQIRSFTGVAIEQAHYFGTPLASSPQGRSAPRFNGLPFIAVMDLALADSNSTALQYVAATADPWPGAFTLWRSVDGSSFEAVQRLSTPASMGVTLNALQPGPLWRHDKVNTLDVELSRGILESVTETALLNGANLLAVGSKQLGWEILGYRSATLIAARRWRLSGFIRGVAGSESFASVAKPAGTQIVILDGTVSELASGTEWLNRRTFYRLSPEGRDHADALATAFEATADSSSLRPLSPQHPRGRRTPAGVQLSWIRRTRFGGDNWELTEIPLNEESEAYLVEVLSGQTIKRSFTVGSPALLYPAALEVSDFGTPQIRIRLRIRQISAAVGPGQAIETDVSITP